MIIDKILDRKDGIPYNANSFYNEMSKYAHDNGNYLIPNAMGMGTEIDVKNALCDYIIENDYNVDICKYINGQDWI